MGNKKRFILILILATLFRQSHGQGCQMEDVENWNSPINERIEDTHRGIILDRGTTNIENINSISYGQEAISGGPYLTASLSNNRFILQTTSAFENYERYETELTIFVSGTFACTQGTTFFMISVEIIDRNNNEPEFISKLEFVVTPPMPPGFLVSGCNDILVRDIDLTTSAIDFTLEENPYFEIEYINNTTPKIFSAVIKAVTFIRSMSGPITLNISATDVDSTNDPRITTYATVTIDVNTDFQFPEELIFSKTLYLANYTDDHQIILFETIYLEQGYDVLVNFTLQGDYLDNFALDVSNGNEVLLIVTNPLPADVMNADRIKLIVRADREYTSGTSATIIIRLPEVIPLSFENAIYRGSIEDNVLEVPDLMLSQGYEGVNVTAEITGEYYPYFDAIVQENVVTLTMNKLNENIIENNDFISLEVVARTDQSETTTVVILDIIKDDNVTPVFDQPIYNGTYDPVTGLTVDQIVFVQGLDETVTVELLGEHRDLFQPNKDGNVITITSSSIPEELFSEQNIMLTIVASKPRTVGANAAIIIALPEAKILDFEEDFYKGTIQDNILTLEDILLRDNFGGAVNYQLSGELSNYFEVTGSLNIATIILKNDLIDDVIDENNIIPLTLTASATNAVSATTSILLDIIKEDKTTPIFSKNIYYGNYLGLSYFEIDPINLLQGYDTGVSFRLDGEHSQYFSVSNTLDSVTISLRSDNNIPEELIFTEKVLAFNILADKALTVGANAAVLIRFPPELTNYAVVRFSQNTYVGSLENNVLSIEDINLETGSAAETEFNLSGDFEDYFTLTRTTNGVRLSKFDVLPTEVIEENNFIVLEIEAKRERAVSAFTSVVVEFVRDPTNDLIVIPKFNQAFYRGVYTEADGLQFEESIYLIDGYDDDIVFTLVEDTERWFSLVDNSSVITLELNTQIPRDVIENNNQLLFTILAYKANNTSGRAVLSIELPKETENPIQFSQDYYKGSYENGSLNFDTITIQNGVLTEINYTLTGEYSEYFQISRQGESSFVLEIETQLTESIINENDFVVLVFEIETNQGRSHTVIIIEIAKEHNVDMSELSFEENFYVGSFSEFGGLISPEIAITEEINDLVNFNLEGDNIEYFDIERRENYVVLTIKNSIPAEVISNNQQLIFTITADRAGSETARATIVIAVESERTDELVTLGFERVYYLGSIQNNEANIPPIVLSEGWTENVTFSLHGELADHFTPNWEQNILTVSLTSEIEEQSIPANNIIVLEVRASSPEALPAVTTLIIEYVTEDVTSPAVELVFSQTYYTGSHNIDGSLTFPTPISLASGYDHTVEFALVGEHEQYFELQRLSENSVTLRLTGVIPGAVLANNQQLILVVTADRAGSETARATIVIVVESERTDELVMLGFERVYYLGSIQNNEANIPPIVLSEGWTENVTFSLHGELADHFTPNWEQNILTVSLTSEIEEQSIPANNIIVLEVRASSPEALPAVTTLIIEYVTEDVTSPAVELVFSQTYYTGSHNIDGSLTFPTPISLASGYDQTVEFALVGEHEQYFELQRLSENSVTLRLTGVIPGAVLANNQQLILVVTADRAGSETARATIVIVVESERTDELVMLGFERVYYLGSIQNNEANIPPIVLSEGWTENVTFSLHGELADHFTPNWEQNILTVSLTSEIEEQLIPANNIIVLEVRASSPEALPAVTTLIIEYVTEDVPSPAVELVFSQTYYTGSYNIDGSLTFPTPVSLASGYDQTVEFALVGEHEQYFELQRLSENSVTLRLTGDIPNDVLANNHQLILVVTADRAGSETARTVIVITLHDDSQGADVSFNKFLFEGLLQNGILYHENITLDGFTGSNIELYGAFASQFESDLTNGIVSINLRESGASILPSDLTHIALELVAGSARAVLLMDVQNTEPIIPSQPVVTFSSETYSIRVEIIQTGLIGQVQATVDNLEPISYSLLLDNSHLEQRLSINSAGELYLSAPVNSGVYAFQVVATTQFSQATGKATVYLSVEAVTVCGNEIVMPPLIVLNRDEEEAHYDLINGTQYDGCHFRIANRWPMDKEWLYVDETGLHTVPIDREHESIAFMPLSQVQVEITLHCDNDNTRVKRSLNSDSIVPYDYGMKTWVLTNTIHFNSRRTLVNLIVNDINDNAPIFVGKEDEPIAFGYPVPELQEVILPRALAELHATDADIGFNAVIRYWSSSSELAVSPSSGFVHVRDGSTLEQDGRMTVHATDQNGQGLTGSIDIIVKLLDQTNIAVVTVQDAFLDDETTILKDLSDAVEYDIKVLRSIVVSQDVDNVDDRRKREVTNASGASLQLYIYGLIDRDPVTVEQLRTDVNNAALSTVSVTNIVSLEDHLAGQEICVIMAAQDTGLLAATIVLSVLLFIVLVLIALWLFLKWRRKNYDQFSDENSLTSQNESLGQIPKPEPLTKPRLNIEELKKSERKLQERLDAPVEVVTVEETPPTDNIIDIPSPEPKIENTPIVIQSIEKIKDVTDDSSDDEFGEIKQPRRKSVVTFNENVEKIIHVEDNDDNVSEDSNATPDFEVYKL